MRVAGSGRLLGYLGAGPSQKDPPWAPEINPGLIGIEVTSQTSCGFAVSLPGMCVSTVCHGLPEMRPEAWGCWLPSGRRARKSNCSGVTHQPSSSSHVPDRAKSHTREKEILSLSGTISPWTCNCFLRRAGLPYAPVSSWSPLMWALLWSTSHPPCGALGLLVDLEQPSCPLAQVCFLHWHHFVPLANSQSRPQPLPLSCKAHCPATVTPEFSEPQAGGAGQEHVLSDVLGV